MVKTTWILTPDLSDINIDDIHDYSCYDDKCLISTFFRDEILDFLEEMEIKNVDIFLDTENKFQYKAKFDIDIVKLNNISRFLITFKTGRFKTTSIYTTLYKTNDNDKWIKYWKKGVFY